MAKGRLSRVRDNACRRKVKHHTREAAEAALDATRGDKPERMGPYRCRFCRFWHNGHAPTEHVPGYRNPLPAFEPGCGCGHGADAHDEWWVPNGSCAFCSCMTSREILYRAYIRDLKRRLRLQQALVRAACALYPAALKELLRVTLANIAARLRKGQDVT